MKKIVEILSFKGVFGRLEYLIYGLILPIILIVLTGIISKQLNEYIVFIGFVIALYFFIIATVKRARDTKYNTVGLIILNLIPYIGIIGQLILFFSPHGEKDSTKSRLTTIIISVFLGIVALGFISALVIPKLSKYSQEFKQKRENVSNTGKLDNLDLNISKN